MLEKITQIKYGIKLNVYLSAKNIIYVNICENPATCSCKSGKYLESIIDDSVITCDEIIEEKTKAVPVNFNEKK